MKPYERRQRLYCEVGVVDLPGQPAPVENQGKTP